MNKNIVFEILPRALFGVMVLCLLLSQYLTVWPPRLTDNTFLFWFGIILTIIGFLFWIYVVYYMQVNGGLRIKNKNLLTEGPFRYVRHPMYVSGSIMLVGIGILFFSWVWFLILFIFAPIWYIECKIEERYLIKLFGERYLDYRKKTGMFFPKTS